MMPVTPPHTFRLSRGPRFWPAAIAIACSLAATVVRGDGGADEVHRVGGGVIRGQIADLAPGAVTITTQSGSTARIAIDEVRFVRFADEPAALSDARSLLLRQDGGAALDELAKMTDADRATLTSAMRADLAYVKAAATGRVAIATGSGLEQAAKTIRDYLAAHGKSHHLYATHEVLGGVLARAGRHAEAAAAYGEMAKGPPAVAARAAALRAEVLILQDNPAEALREYGAAAAAAAKIDGEPARLAKLTADLGAARCQVLLRKPDAAIAACRGVVAACRPDDAGLLSRAYLVLGQAQLATGTHDQDAAVSLLTVDLVHNTVAADRAEALFLLIGLWERTNHPERARETRQALEASYPESPWIKKLPPAAPS